MMKISIKLQFIIFFSVCITVAICLASGFFYYYFNNEVTGRSFSDLNKTFLGYASGIDSLFEKIQKFNDNLSADEILIEAVNHAESGVIEQLAVVNQIKSEYNKLAYLFFDGSSQNVTNRFLVSADMPASKNIPRLEGADIFKKEGPTIYRNSEVYEENLQNKQMEIILTEENGGSIIFSQPIYDHVRYFDQLIGMHLVKVDVERLLFEYKRASNYTIYTAVLYGNNKLVCSDADLQREELDALEKQLKARTDHIDFTQFRKGGKTFALNEYPLKFDMKLLVWVDWAEVSLKTKELGYVICLIALLTLLPVLIIMSVMLGRLTRPIRDLSNIMLNFNVDTSAWGEHSDVGSIEVQRLYDCFRQLVKKIQCLIAKAHIQGEREKEMEMKLLAAQISPHFLYNALDSITWMALSREENDIADMISALAEGFRYSIKETERPITIQEEINFIIGYLHLQELRYKGSFNFKLDVDKETKSLLIPKFILQPLIENSIVHGLGNQERTISIILSVKMKGEKILISIADNGPGFDSEQLNRYLAGDSSIFSTEKIGIKNVYERIRMKFGEQFGLKYRNSGDYLIAEVCIPAMIQNECGEEQE